MSNRVMWNSVVREVSAEAEGWWLTKTVDFLSSKYDGLLSQIKQMNEKIQNQSACLSRTQKEYEEQEKTIV